MERKPKRRLLAVSLMVTVLLSTMISKVSLADDTDWSVKLCDSIIARYTPATFGPWEYNQGLVLEGMWRVYQRTGNTGYYNFIKDWVDRFVTSGGLDSDISLDSLDNMMPGVLLCHLYQATGDNKYKTAAQQIRNRINTYPRTSDGGLVHNTTTRSDQLWLDGAFMLTIFLINYGDVFNDATYCNNECCNQLIIYNSHLKYPATKLAWHAWDEDGSSSWADPITHLSPEVWCRALGWYVVACSEVLEKLPVDHANRQAIVDILVERLQGIKDYQDNTTGLWYQVVDKGNLVDNWVEESSGCMYTYVMSKAIDAGYVSSADYDITVKEGYEGILSNIQLDLTGKTNLYGTCEGTAVGSSYSYYIGRAQVTNDNHGQGAFLLANEQLGTKYTDLRQLYQAENGSLYRAVTETTNRGFTGASYVNLNNEIGSYLEITVSTASAGMKTLIIRYANGTADDRPMKMYVNGNVAYGSLSLPPTGAWTAWKSQPTGVSLNAGNNIIRFESITSTGGPNVDWIAVGSLSLESYSDAAHTIACDNFTDYGTQHTAYIYGTGLLPSHDYRVAYYDGGGSKRATDDQTSGASGNLISQHTFVPGTDAAGSWHVIVCEPAFTPSDTYESGWAYTLAEDSFIVSESAIPEFATALAAIFSLGLCAGIYLWLRRKAVPVPT
jgi:unsaturated rhamnogalacturonyl hydrolase